MEKIKYFLNNCEVEMPLTDENRQMALNEADGEIEIIEVEEESPI